jgi:hypothetical protein
MLFIDLRIVHSCLTQWVIAHMIFHFLSVDVTADTQDRDHPQNYRGSSAIFLVSSQAFW